MAKGIKAVIDLNEFVTYGGKYKVPLQPVSPFSVEDAIAKASKEVPEPDCPTYQEPTDVGEPIIVKMDEKAIEQYPELKPAWDAYNKAMAEHDIAVNKALSDIYIVEGTPDEWKPPEEWVEHRRMKFAELVPDDSEELKIYWMRREVLRRPSDFGEFTKMVAELSEMTPARLKQVEDRFQREMGQSDGQDNSGVEG